MESETDCETNCSQKLLHVARTVGIFFAKLLQLLLQTRSLAKHAFTLWLTTALHCSYTARRYSKSKAFGSKLE